MVTEKEVSKGGLSFLSTIGIIFIILKLTDNIDWSWWWVLLPFWGPMALTLVFVLIILVVALFMIPGKK